MRRGRAAFGHKHIYAPHGSFILFTRDYFARGGHLDYPVFLFGEEVFLAETIRLLDMRVIYTPDLVVYDDDHVSTGRVARRRIGELHAEAAKYLLATYFPAPA